MRKVYSFGIISTIMIIGLIQASPMGIWDKYYSVNENEYLTFENNMTWIEDANLAILPDQSALMSMNASMPENTTYGTYLETRFQWTPSYCQGGSEYALNVDQVVNDGPAENTYIYHITVNDVNRDPVVVATTSRGSLLYSFYSVRIGTEASITFTKSDLDRDICSDDTVNFVNQSFESSYVTEAAWTSSGEDNLTWTWTPTVEGDLGTHQVSVEVMDSHGATYKETITVSAYRPSHGSCTPYSPKYRFRIEPPRGSFCLLA